MVDILNSNIQATNTFASSPVSGRTFGVPIFIAAPGSCGPGFEDSVRYYADSAGVAVDLASGDITQTAADALNAALSQDPRVAQVGLGNVPGAASKVTEVTVAGTVTDGDAFEIHVDPDGDDFTITYAASVPSDDAAAVILGLIADAPAKVPARYLFEVGGSADKLIVTDLLKGVDVTVSAEVAGVATISAATTTEASGSADTYVVEILDAGAEGDIWTLTFDGIAVAYTVLPGDTEDEVSAALQELINALPYYSAFGNVEPVSPGFFFTSEFGAVSISAPLLTNDGTGTSTLVSEQTATPIGPLMDALILDDPSWYYFASEVKTQGINLDLAAWTEATNGGENKQRFIAQSSEVGARTSEPESTGELLKALGYARTAYLYRPDDEQESAFSWIATVLSADPDVEVSTWAYRRLRGSTPDLTMTLTERAAMESSFTNFYNQIRGRPGTWKGVACDGEYLDVGITRDWLDARLAEGATNVIVNASYRGSKIPFTDPGIQQVASSARALLFTVAINAGHIQKVFDDSGRQVSPDVFAPLRRKVPQADVDAALIRIGYVAHLTNAILESRIKGFVTSDLNAGISVT